MIDLKRLKELEARATKGPWRKGRDDMDSFDASTGDQFANVYSPEREKHPTIADMDVPLIVTRVMGEGSHDCHADARLIAESRNALPELLDFIEKAVPFLEHFAELGDTWDDHGDQIVSQEDCAEAAALLGRIEK